MNHGRSPRTEIPGWKRLVGLVSAVLLGLLFLVSGLWKLSDPLSAAERMVQSLIPSALSLPAALAVGIGETFVSVLLFWPRFRRWGALLAGVMLVAFMVYIAIFYSRLTGEECNCFPLIKRVVGPMFFVGDGIMLALALLAGWWTEKSRGLRLAAFLLLGVSVLALLFLGAAVLTRSGIRAPETISVEGRPYSLASGRALLYFFDPECTHCDAVARKMAAQKWGDAKLIAVPTAQPQFAADFLSSTGLKASISNDAGLLRRTFKFVDSPYVVVLVDGRQKAAFNSGQLDTPGFYETLRGLKFVK